MNSIAADGRVESAPPPAPVLDAPARLFLGLARDYNTNSNQVLVVRGDLDGARLRDAVHRAVRRFAHVLLDPADPRRPRDASEVPVHEAQWEGPCTLRDAAFRDALMRLSDEHRIDWRRRPATQVFLVRSRDRRTCAVYLNSAHAAADAASDCMLLAEIIAQYRAPRAVTTAPAYQPIGSVPALGPRWSARLARWRSAAAHIASSSRSHDLALPTRASSRWGYAPRDAAAGFQTSILPAGFMQSILQAARVHAVTVNTIFAAAIVRLMAARGEPAHACRLSIPVSLRSMRPGVGRDEAFGNHVVTGSIRTRGEGNAASLVRAVHRAVADLRSARMPLEVGRVELALPWLAIGALHPIARRAMARAQATNICYSNPGVIAQDFSTFGDPAHPVLEYTGLGCLVSPFDVMLYTTTVGGRTQLDVLYRRACFESIEDELMAPYRAQLTRLVGELLDAQAGELPPGWEWFA